jgi:hypothetical protein
MKKLPILVMAFLFIAISLKANDTLLVKVNQKEFFAGDTLSFDATLHYSNKHMAAVTLNVWIEDLLKNRRWKYRYPLLNGYAGGDIIISEKIPPGKYAVNFLLQDEFFKIDGTIQDYSTKTTSLNYLMLTKQKRSLINFTNVDAVGNFRVKNIVFEDTARFIFSQIGKKKSSLTIALKTPLDSAFTPMLSNTQFFTLKSKNNTIVTDTANNYVFDSKRFGEMTLDDVTVTTKAKKKVEKFEEEFVSALFQGGNAKVFDGIDDTELGSSLDIFSFLQGRVAGLDISRGEDGNYIAKWRSGNTEFFVDEFKTDAEGVQYLSTADVAMIKVFSPPAYLSAGGSDGGAIAIYTKRGVYADNKGRKFNFLIKGYTPAAVIWQ